MGVVMEHNREVEVALPEVYADWDAQQNAFQETHCRYYYISYFCAQLKAAFW